MQPLVVEYLKTHSLSQLSAEHGVNARFSRDMAKFSLNYDQIAAKSGDVMAEQCRGLVLGLTDEKLIADLAEEMTKHPTGSPLASGTWNDHMIGETRVLAWPMNRFYNHGDPAAANVNWNDDTRVLEKLDGTMCILYWDDRAEKWRVATRSVPDADVPITGHISVDLTREWTFRELFWDAYQRRHGFMRQASLDCRLDKNITYVFELIGPANRVVVKYDEADVVLLARRDRTTGDELPINVVEPLEVRRPATIVLPKNDGFNAGAVHKFVDTWSPDEFEGVVVIDRDFNRVKIKNAAWVVASRVKDMLVLSRRAIVHSIIDRTIDDVIPIVDEDSSKKLIEMRDKVAEYFLKIDKSYAELKARHGDDRKAFAIAVMETKNWSPAYFAMFTGTCSSTGEYTKSLADSNRLTPATCEVLLQKIDCLNS